MNSFNRMRQNNRFAVLSLIRARAPVARVDLADASGLTKPTVSDIVSELLAEGWVREIGSAPGTVGRRPTLLEFVPDARLVVGVDVGITAVRVGLLDLQARLLARTEKPLTATAPESVVTAIWQGVETVIEGIPREKLLGMGLGLHGLVDPDTGICRFAPHFGWRNLQIRQRLEERIGLPVQIDNDVRAMALGESLYGAGRTAGTLVVVSVGAGIGSGIVMHGNLYRGLHGGAGEIGHTKVDPNGLPCSCGGRGCLETVAAAPAVVAQAVERLGRGEASSLAGVQRLSTEAISEAARAGDPLAQDLMRRAGQSLGIAITNLVHLLNPEVIAVGGGMTAAGSVLLDPLSETVRREALPGLTDGLTITLVHGGPDAGIIGAAALILQPALTGGIAQ